MDPFVMPHDVTDSLRLILGFVAWTVTGMCVLALLFIAGQMALSHRRGESAEHPQALAYVFAAVAMTSVASVIANLVLGGG
jgi:uncharacterized membrane protein SirB2